LATRPTLAALLCLLLAACTGGGGELEEPAQPAAPSLTLTVVSMPLNCQAVPGVPAGCQVGGSGVVEGFGKVRVYHSVRLGQPRPGGCREAATTGSISGAGGPTVFLDTPEVSAFRWGGCRDSAELVHYRINGGNHQAPRTIAGQPIADVLWDFVAAHPIPG
jgi:hypothetical protein